MMQKHRKILHPHVSLASWWLGNSLLLVGERGLQATSRFVVSMVGLLLMVAVMGLWLWRWQRATKGMRQGLVMLLPAHATWLIALLLYGSASLGTGFLAQLPQQHVALGLAAVLWLLAAQAFSSGELCLGSMRWHSQVIELWRMHLAMQSALIAGATVIAFAALNVTGVVFNRTVDASYFQTTKPSVGTLELLRNATAPVELLAFFPPGSDVLEAVRGYLSRSQQAVSTLSYRVVDQTAEPALSQQLKVRGNGYLVLQTQGHSESLRIGLDMHEAREHLRNLDSEVQQHLLTLLKPARVVYFTSGHLERSLVAKGDSEQPGRALSQFKRLLEMQGAQVRHLGLGEGLGQAVPADATLLVVANPLEAFLPEEMAAIKTYLQHGGAALWLLEGEQADITQPLLSMLSLTLHREMVGHSTFNVRREGESENRHNLVTNATVYHPTVTTLVQHAQRMWVVMLGSGYLTGLSEVGANPLPHAPIQFPLLAMPQSYVVDAQGKPLPKNVADGGDYRLMAVVENTHPAASNANAEAAAGMMRVVVTADCDWVSDIALSNPGNLYLAMDTLRYLHGDAVLGDKAVESEKDVPIVHRKTQDAWWFYSCCVLMPGLLVVVGFYACHVTPRRERFKSL